MEGKGAGPGEQEALGEKRESQPGQGRMLAVACKCFLRVLPDDPISCLNHLAWPEPWESAAETCSAQTGQEHAAIKCRAFVDGPAEGNVLSTLNRDPKEQQATQGTTDSQCGIQTEVTAEL